MEWNLSIPKSSNDMFAQHLTVRDDIQRSRSLALQRRLLTLFVRVILSVLKIEIACGKRVTCLVGWKGCCGRSCRCLVVRAILVRRNDGRVVKACAC